MNTPTLAEDIARGRVIMKEIAGLQEELKAITKRMEKRALKGPHEPLEDATRSGRQFRAAGAGVILPVVITADNLVQGFQDQSAVHLAIAAAAGEHLDAFFKRSVVWETRLKDGKEFRDTATVLLGVKAPAFVSACVAKNRDGIPKNKIEVAWARAIDLPAEAVVVEGEVTA